jgi:prepilin-type N-terminal cleavage/methylation domain-containing protein
MAELRGQREVVLMRLQRGNRHDRRLTHSTEMASDAGMSMMEMVIVLALISVVCASAIGVTADFLRQAKADSTLLAALNGIQIARNRAVGERRYFQVSFLTPNRIQVTRIETTGATTAISDTYLENGQSYQLFAGLPDTPDRFGKASAVDFGTTPTIRFTSDASLLDASGDVVNGTVFFGETGKPSTARAITIFGGTGLIRTWKWNGLAWIQG